MDIFRHEPIKKGLHDACNFVVLSCCLGRLYPILFMLCKTRQRNGDGPS